MAAADISTLKATETDAILVAATDAAALKAAETYAILSSAADVAALNFDETYAVLYSDADVAALDAAFGGTSGNADALFQYIVDEAVDIGGGGRSQIFFKLFILDSDN